MPAVLFAQGKANKQVDSFLNAAYAYKVDGKWAKALDCYISASKIQDKAKDKIGLAKSYQNIGKIYLTFAEFKFNNKDSFYTAKQRKKDTNIQFAVSYLEKSIKLSIKLGDSAMTQESKFYLDKANALKILPNVKVASEKPLVSGAKTKRQTIDSAYRDSLNQELQKLKDQLEKDKSLRKTVENKRDSLFRKLIETQINISNYEKERNRMEDSLQMEIEKHELMYQKDAELMALKFDYDKRQELAKTEKEKDVLRYEQQLKAHLIEKEYAIKTAEAETRFKIKQRNIEIKQKEGRDKVNQEKKDARTKLILNASLIGLLGFILFSVVVYRQRNAVKKEKGSVEIEKARSEELLLNILPEDVAEELKSTGASMARRFENITVLFSDFKSFTQFSENISAETLVEELHISFKKFDAIMQKYGIEKIKTIGDSYMAASGMGHGHLDSVKNAVMAGIEMQDFIIQLKAERESRGELAFEMRVGIHTGPVVAGIVGVKKFAYDIWGDTVNTASRMESSGEPGKVNISGVTYNLIKDEPEFKFTPRGKVMAKGKGEMEMYFVGLKFKVNS